MANPAKARRREELVLAAAEVIEEYGPGVRTARIAERAGVPRPHVYRHFTSKDDLDDALARHAARELVSRIRPRLTAGGTPREIISGPVGEAVAWAGAHPNLYRFLAMRTSVNGRAPLLAELVDASTAYLRTLGLDIDPPAQVAAGVIGMVDATILWWLDNRDALAADELTGQLTAQVWLLIAEALRRLDIPVGADTHLAVR